MHIMQIRLVLPLVLVLSLGLLACQQADNSRPGIAVVDMARVMRDSEPGKAGVKFLEGLQADMQKKLNEIQKRLETKPDDATAQKELQTTYITAQQRMQAEQQNVINVLYDAMQRVANAYRTEKGYDVILSTESVTSFDAKVDVTNAILAAMNKQKIEFKPMAVPESPADASADAPADAAKQEAGKPSDAAPATDTKAAKDTKAAAPKAGKK